MLLLGCHCRNRIVRRVRRKEDKKMDTDVFEDYECDGQLEMFKEGRGCEQTASENTGEEPRN